VVDLDRGKWIDAAKRAVAGDAGPIRCPENADADLAVTWLPASEADPEGRGEYRLRCPDCGAESYLLVSRRGR
jgi:hypothetical protein